ncbi:MAG: right-handed parallel beta-helix repeat-containing protein [Parvularculaceae bacterium]
MKRAAHKLALNSAAAVLMIGAAEARDVTASDPGALTAALEDLAPGDRVVLAPGDYGELRLGGASYSPGVQFASADPANPARFTQVRLTDVAGVSLKDLKVAYGPTVAPASSNAIFILRSRDVSVDGGEALGSADGDPTNDGNAIVIDDSRAVTISRVRLHNALRGVTIYDSDDVVVTDSVFEANAADGLAGGGVVGLTVERNVFRDFDLADPENVHPDAIQLWDRGAARANENVRIVGNAILRGSGDPVQGIFINSKRTPSVGVTIEDNIVHQSMPQGIAVHKASDVAIRRNTVAAYDWSHDLPAIDVRDPGGTFVVEGNLAPSYRMAAGAEARDNVTLSYDDPWAEGFVDRWLVAPYEGARTVAADLSALGGAGARYADDVADGAPDDMRHALAAPARLDDFTFSLGAGSASDWRYFIAPMNGAFANPSFRELGAGAGGPTADWRFNEPGLARIDARVGGAVRSKLVRVFPTTLVDLAAGLGDDGAPSFIDAAPERADLEGAAAGYGVEGDVRFATFNGSKPADGAQYFVAQDPALSTALRLRIDARLRRSAPGGDWERMINLPGVYLVRFRNDQLRFQVTNRAGETGRIVVDAPSLVGATWRDLALVYDGVEGRLSVEVDGAVVASKSGPTGPIKREPNQKLYLGGEPWGASFKGDVQRLTISR